MTLGEIVRWLEGKLMPAGLPHYPAEVDMVVIRIKILHPDPNELGLIRVKAELVVQPKEQCREIDLSK